MSLYNILGFFPHNICYYRAAFQHRSVKAEEGTGNEKNNERLEFLGDAILDAAVGDIVYRHFPGKPEGFLTNTRSKLVQRNTLNRLAGEMGIVDLVQNRSIVPQHNSYMGGNAFEALVGAIYLDRGYDACIHFLKSRVLSERINIDKVAYKEVNFKSKLIEWCQKMRMILDFEEVEVQKDRYKSPIFTYRAIIEGHEGALGKGFSKKESQQLASKATLLRIKREPQFLHQLTIARNARQVAVNLQMKREQELAAAQSEAAASTEPTEEQVSETALPQSDNE